MPIKSRSGTMVSQGGNKSSRPGSRADSDTRGSRPTSGVNRRPKSSASNKSRSGSTKKEPKKEPGSTSQEEKAPSPEPRIEDNNPRQSPDNDKHAREEVDQEKERSGSPAGEEREENHGDDINDHHDDEENYQASEPEEVKFNPEDFQPREFMHRVSELSEKLRAPEYRSLDQSFDGQELTTMVSEVTLTMGEFNAYSEYAQHHLSKLRDQLKEIKDRMYKRVNSRAYDPRNGEYTN